MSPPPSSCRAEAVWTHHCHRQMALFKPEAHPCGTSAARQRYRQKGKEMEWVPVVFIVFKLLVFGTGMFFAIKWHYDQDQKNKKK